MSKEIVCLKNVYVYFNKLPVLENINLSIKENDFLAIIGPNGGGKTTLLKVILGLIKPDKGEVKIFGKNPKEGRKLIGYLPQYTIFDPGFPASVFDVVVMGRYKGMFKGYSKKDKEEALDATMVFILREIMIAFLEHSTTVYYILGYAVLLLSIGIVRTMCVVYSIDGRRTNNNRFT